MDKKNSIWVDLYNGLYILSLPEGNIDALESPVFETMDELENSLFLGCSDEALSFFLERNWISFQQKGELTQLRKEINKINDELWNLADFEMNEDWNLVRSWGQKLFVDLGLEKTGFDNSGSQIIWLPD